MLAKKSVYLSCTSSLNMPICLVTSKETEKIGERMHIWQCRSEREQASISKCVLHNKWMNGWVSEWMNKSTLQKILSKYRTCFFLKVFPSFPNWGKSADLLFKSWSYQFAFKLFTHYNLLSGPEWNVREGRSALSWISCRRPWTFLPDYFLGVPACPGTLSYRPGCS